MLFFVNALFSFMYHLRKNFRRCIKRQNRLYRRSKKLFLQLRAIENDTCEIAPTVERILSDACNAVR